MAAAYASGSKKLICGAIDLMQRRGVSAAGLTEIVQQNSVSRRSVYLNLPGGKPELVAAATTATGVWITAQIQKSCENDDPFAAASDFFVQTLHAWSSEATAPARVLRPL